MTGRLALIGPAAVAIVGAIGLLLIWGPGHQPSPASAKGAAHAYGSLPLGFQPNRGQSDRAVRFLSNGAGYGLFLTGHRAVLALQETGGSTGDRDGGSNRTSVLSMSLIGAKPNPPIEGEHRLPGRVSYLSGSLPRATGIPTYSAVRYAGAWPGIGVRFYGNQRRLEYDFALAPGASAGDIGLRFSGQRRLRIGPDGALALRLGSHTIRQLPPHAYQVIGGARHPVASRYVSRGGGIGIALGPYDHSRALTVDPQLVYSTYIGSGIDGRGSAIAVDSGGHAYITGSTTAPEFPTTAGTLQSKGSGRGVAFVTKLNRAGNRAIYSTFLGGRSGSAGNAIAIDRNGDAFVAGLAYAPDFPTTKGAFQASAPGFENGFVSKLAPNGRRLLYSTYLGSHGEEGGLIDTIAIDPSGNAYVAGYTFSAVFPTTPGAAEGASPGGIDGFAAKLDPSGSHLVYSTYIGGSGDDDAHDIAVDGAGNAYVTGSTASRDFPTSPGAFQTVNLAELEFTNAFVTKINPAGTGFSYSTYLGGHGLDDGSGIVVDSHDNAHVTGEAGSPDFPTTKGAFQTRLRGFAAAFVATLNPEGNRLLHSTLIGGGSESDARGRGIVLDRAGNAYIAGLTGARDFPTTPGSIQRANRSPRGYNGFVAKLNPPGTRLLYSTYLGGRGSRVASIALDHSGAVYVTGGSGPRFPTTPNGLRQARVRGAPEYPNAFVVKLRPKATR